MLKVSDSILNAYKKYKTQRKSYIKVNDKTFFIENLEVTGDVYNEGNIIGNAIAKTARFDIETINVKNIDEFELFDGIWTGNQYEYVSLGTFKLFDESGVDDFFTTITAYDKLINFNSDYDPSLITFPIPMYDFLVEICKQGKIELLNTSIPNGDKIIQENIFVEGEKLKQILCAICQINGCFGIVSGDKLKLLLKNDDCIILDKSQISNPDYKRTTWKINQVILGMSDVDGEYSIREDKGDIEKNGVHKIVINDNPFVYSQDLREEYIDNLFNQVKGFGYIAFEAAWEGMPFVELGDSAIVDGKDSIILRYTLKSPKGLESSLAAPSIIDSVIDYVNNSNSIKNQQSRTEYKVDKANRRIDTLTTVVDENTEKISKTEQTVEGISESVEYLNNQYQKDVITKKTVESENPIIINEAGPYSLEELTFYGNTEQETKSGRNLYVNSDTFEDVDKHGVIDDIVKLDGSYSIRTSIAWEGPFLNLQKIIADNNLKIGDTVTYSIYAMINFIPKSNMTFTIFRNIANDGGQVAEFSPNEIVPNEWIRIHSTFQINEYSLTEKATECRIECAYYDPDDPYYFGNDRQNYIWFSRPQFELGELTDYESYGVTPSPAFQSKIKNVTGDMINFFNAKNIKNKDIIIEENGKKIVMPFDSVGNGNVNTQSTLRELCPNLQVGDNVYLFFKRNYGNLNDLIFLDKANFLWWRDSQKEITEDDLNSNVYLYGNRFFDGEEEQITLIDFVITKEKNKNFVPFGTWLPIKQKSPNFYNYKEIMPREHMNVSEDGWVTIEADNTNGESDLFVNCYTEDLNVELGKKYNIFVEVKEHIGNGSLFTSSYYPESQVGQFNVMYSKKFMELENESIIHYTAEPVENVSNRGLRTFVVFGKGQKGSITFRISVLEDTSITEKDFVYSQYQNEIAYIDLNKYDEAENVIGYYELCSQDNIRDEINMDNRVVLTKRINEYICTGDENIDVENDTQNSFIFGRFPIANSSKETTRQPITSNYFKYAQTENKIGTAFIFNGFFYFQLANNYITAEQYKQFLKEKYEEGNPVKIQYVLENEQDIDLGECEITLLEGKNYIHILDQYDLIKKCKISYLTNSFFNAQFASKAELRLTADEIASEVSKKVTIENFNTTVEDLNSKIRQSAESIEESVSKNTNDIESLNNTMKSTMTATEQRFETIEKKGTETLRNGLVTIDINGITVSANYSKISALMSNNAFIVKDNEGKNLIFIGYDEEEGRSKAEMDNLLIREHFTAAYHRTEKYIDPETGEPETGRFWVGEE